MAVYKVAVFLTKSGFGVGESYYTPDQSAGQIGATIQRMLENRVSLLTTDWALQGVRISEVGSRRKSRLFIPGTWNWPDVGQTIVIPPRGTIVAAGDATNPDQVRAVIQYTVGFDGLNRSAIRYLSGIPDAISATEPGVLDLTKAANWATAFQKFRGDLILSGWQIRARTTPPTDPEHAIVAYVIREAAPALVGVGIDTGQSPNIVRGDRVHMRGQRMKGFDKRTMNGIWVVDSVNTTLVPSTTIYFLKNSEGINIANVKLNGTLQRVRYSQFPIQSTNPLRVGIHKRGRPTLTPRGRRVTRLTLDP